MLCSRMWRGNQWKGRTSYPASIQLKRCGTSTTWKAAFPRSSSWGKFVNEGFSFMLNSPPSPLENDTLHSFTKGLEYHPAYHCLFCLTHHFSGVFDHCTPHTFVCIKPLTEGTLGAPRSRQRWWKEPQRYQVQRRWLLWLPSGSLHLPLGQGW